MNAEMIEFPIDRSMIDIDSAALFWYVIDIWWKKPHCVNKRLCGAVDIDIDIISDDDQNTLSPMRSSSKEEMIKELNFLFGGIEDDGISIEKFKYDESAQIRKLLPKDTSGKYFQAVDEVMYKNLDQCAAIFIPRPANNPVVDGANSANLKSPHVDWPYAIWLRKAPLQEKAYLVLKRVTVDNGDDQDGRRDSDWLISALMPTLIRWINHCSPDKPLTKPLRLVDLRTYNECYNRLKAKYGKRLVQIWPERTDPKKFVYEDIAIAAYLLTLWEEERTLDNQRKQSFVDLGCGNGLLVYLLTNEGHDGYGIDVRKRLIWQSYGPNVKLIEGAFEPSDQHLFPDADWIIGNHSDELTPWIPVIAAKSSSTCNFLTIPCCAWDFRGKYQRQDQGISTYRSYIRYVAEIGRRCGFETEQDILKIPSTKRVCVVGRRNKENEILKMEIVEQNIARLLLHSAAAGRRKPENDDDDHDYQHNHDHEDDDDKKSDRWIEEDAFSKRQVKEAVRNCTTLPKTSIEEMVNKVARVVLKDEHYVDTKDGRKWNAGGSQPIPKCVESLNDHELQLLKSQCGGLQTLLRNHRHIFKVIKGNVSIHQEAPPGNGAVVGNQKRRPCWFHKNHPNGCPLDADSCIYSHLDGNGDAC